MMPKRRGADVGALSHPMGSQYSLEVGAPEIDPEALLRFQQEQMMTIDSPEVMQLDALLRHAGRPGIDAQVDNEFSTSSRPDFAAQTFGPADISPAIQALLASNFGGQEPVGPPSDLDEWPLVEARQWTPEDGDSPPLDIQELQELAQAPSAYVDPPAPEQAPRMGGTQLDLAKHGNEKDLMWANFMLENGFYG